MLTTIRILWSRLMVIVSIGFVVLIAFVRALWDEYILFLIVWFLEWYKKHLIRSGWYPAVWEMLMWIGEKLRITEEHRP